MRRVGFDRNPMRRCSDRLQALVRVVLLAMFVIGGPLATALVSHDVYSAGLRAQRAEVMAWHRVPARVLRGTLITTAVRQPPSVARQWVLSVRWTTPNGSSRTGQVTSGTHAVAGSTVTVWTDASGRLTHPPLTHTGVVAHAIGAALATTAALALVLRIAARAASLILDRYRLARWEADWLAVEPQWTKKP